MPSVPKLSAGYFARPGMDLIDLFIGSEGTLGIVVDATLGVVARRDGWSRSSGVDDSGTDGDGGIATRGVRVAGRGPLDVSAIEYMDARALRAVPDETFAAPA